MKKFVSLGEFKSLPLSMQKIMFKWWSVSTGDLFVRVYEDRVPELEVVNTSNADLIKSLKNGFAMSNKPSSDVYPIFTEYHLRKFLMDFGYKLVMKNWGVVRFHVFCYLRDTEDIHTSSDDLLSAYWGACVNLLKKLSN